jgi:betaine-aldehyde dehydrogenase
MRHYEHWIDGTGRSSTDGHLTRDNPATGLRVAEFAAGTAADVDAAVSAAKTCFSGSWPVLPASERSLLLNRWADRLDAALEHLARIESEESGKPIRFARGEVGWCTEMTRFAAALTLNVHGDAFTNLGNDRLGLVTREPVGVVGLIVPWNYPLVCLFQKLPFALAAGCTVVIKPSELTSSTAMEIASLAAEVGFPAGAINVVTGKGAVVGDALVRHRDVAMISFTGSTPVGRQIGRTVGDRVGRVALELGGKAANIVFADADLDAAVDGVLFGFTLNQGEECAAGTRLLVQQSIQEVFVEKLLDRVRRVQIGDTLDNRTDVGALISKAHLDRVLSYIESGRAEGATIACGGHRLLKPPYDAGYFVDATVFTNVTPSMRIFREEIFGPILTVTPFRDADHAVELANDTAYGLVNGLWTRDVDKVHQVSRRLRSGTVFVNTYLETAVQMPFGGYKDSGVGRELGLDALHAFTETKSVFLKMGPRTPAFPE